MKVIKFLSVVITSTIVFSSCQPGSSEADNAYEEVVSQTDSIQALHTNVMDSLNMVESMNKEAMNMMDTATDDSTYLATLSRNEVILQEMRATLNKIEEMTGNFEAFESDYSKNEMSQEDASPKVDEIRAQQDEAFSQLNEVERELGRMHNEISDMHERKNSVMTDGEKMNEKNNM